MAGTRSNESRGDDGKLKLLWLRPSVGDHVSVRRERIAEHLREHNVDVEIQDCSGLDALSAVRRAISGDFDVIAGNVRAGLYIGYPLARLLGTPFLGDVSDPISDIETLPRPLFRLLRWYEWYVLSRADATVFVHEVSLKEARRREIDGIKLPNAVDFDRFADPAADIVEEARMELEGEGTNFNQPIAMFIGNLTAGAHIPTIIETAQRTPGWEFVFVGEGPLEAEVAQAAEELENVHFPGAFEYRLMPGFLAHADVGLSLKDTEQSLKVKEYGAAGIPAIVQYGVLEDWYDEDELLFVEPTAGAISQLLGAISDGSLAVTEIAENLHAVARQHSWKHVAERYLEIFERITSGR